MMNERDGLLDKIKGLRKRDFQEIALQVYDYQFANNPLYRRYVQLLKREEDFRPKEIANIPFLPISFFKSHTLKTGEWEEECIYKSSATTGSIRSLHLVRDKTWYVSQAQKTYENLYGPLSQQILFALLPGYVERGESSLVAMAEHFIRETSDSLSGFFLHDLDGLIESIRLASGTGKKVVVLGVSYALYQLAQKEVDLSGVIVMETGGMKGIGPEMPKAAFHDYLKDGLSLNVVHSEYGMTELLSQAYSLGAGVFTPATTMEVLISDVTDPLSWMPEGRGGVVNVIDLVNLDTCAFIQTEDMGVRLKNGAFRLLGRLDAAEIRGCNLLVSDLMS